MKKLKLISLLTVVFMLNVASTCSNDEDDTVPVLNQADVTNTISNGSWRITEFNDSGTDETNDFTGYNFTFGNSGNILASNDTNNYTGTWSVSNNGSNGDSQSDLDFNIGFIATADFAELTQDWHFNLYTPTKIRLIHGSGGGGGTDYLTFEKN